MRRNGEERAAARKSAQDEACGFAVGYSAGQLVYSNTTRQSQSASLKSITETMNIAIKKFLVIVDALPFQDSELQMLAKKAIFYQIFIGLMACEKNPYYVDIVNPLCIRYKMPCTRTEVATAIHKHAPMFQEEGILNKTACGTFWTALMGHLPSSSSGTGDGLELAPKS